MRKVDRASLDLWNLEQIRAKVDFFFAKMPSVNPELRMQSFLKKLVLGAIPSGLYVNKA